MNHRARRVRFAFAAGTVLLIAAVSVFIVVWSAQKHAPTPPASAARPVQVIPSDPVRTTAVHNGHTAGASGSGTTRSRPTIVSRGPVLSRSTPVSVRIPAIGVMSRIQQLGLAPDGTVQVPPLGRDSHVGWYRGSPTPGQLGPSILLGHVDSAAYGPGVFFHLGDLRQRERVLVTRADGSVAVFAIERVVEYAKARFPTLQVYGNLDHAGLRLITCGGTFNPAVSSYEDNIVVYASLVSSHSQ